MKYTIKKAIPVNGLNRVNEIVESSDFPTVNFQNTEYFEPYTQSKYNVCEFVVYLGTLYEVKNVNSGIYQIKDANGCQVLNRIKEVNLQKPNFYWFINSDGVICRDFEQRRAINKTGLNWKKTAGNYFTSLTEATAAKESIIAKK